MKTYIALLRGINVSGQKKIPMAELRELLTHSGLNNVQTYIQSGNVIFQASEENKTVLQAKIHDAIHDHFGFSVPILVLEPVTLNEIFNNSPFPQNEKEKSYFMFLYEKPENKLVKEVSQLNYPNEAFKVTDNSVYFYCSTGYGKAKCSNNFFERKLKVTATARNYKTMVKLLSLSAQ
ncbi:DUF1697 domain-containing protein [Seonamhaeicola marinus]|uniref:DUF1697 domain-containing protein n=1 Tax=Seonamhaeicola marinus TaxID=1912246 RepID=A0A5D0HF39_9FLAO|nr:DUF1697 domain-containing protein [Seonamhaeicola marinus]TYA69906.1 DUF1697 domain-containing protein [Seonamhaeicola marinus]